jgi:transglutaminase-like putative cysteine protease
MKLDKDKKKAIIMVMCVAIILFYFMTTEKSTDKGVNVVEGNWDITKEVKAQGFEVYLVETDDFDYSDEKVNTLAKTIKESTSDPEEAIKNTIAYVADNTRYSSAVTINYCYSEKASDVLEKGFGDCVSMSRLVTALLRAQGIPSRTVGGCLGVSRCDIMFSTTGYFEPQTTAMSEGDFKKRGFLHEWVEVWTPEKGWILVEATAGLIFDTECNTYTQYGYDTNPHDRCVISDLSFWDKCQGVS